MDDSSSRWSRLRVGSLNVQGNLAGKIHELEEHFRSNRYDIVALQEVRKVANLKVKGYRYFGHVQDSGQGGVAFLVALHLASLMTPVVVSPSAPNQLWMKLRGTAGHKDLFFCSAYMPQETDSVGEREIAWNNLSDSIDAIQRDGGVVVIAGDLNARPGRSTSSKERRVLGPYAVGDATANGRLLLDLMVKKGLLSTSGYSRPPKPNSGWITRVDPVHNSSHQS
jgi:exonuclease III